MKEGPGDRPFSLSAANSDQAHPTPAVEPRRSDTLPSWPPVWQSADDVEKALESVGVPSYVRRPIARRCKKCERSAERRDGCDE